MVDRKTRTLEYVEVERIESKDKDTEKVKKQMEEWITIEYFK